MPENNNQDLTQKEITDLEAMGLRSAIRQKIFANAGDRDSILGTTADGAQLLLYGFASLVAALNKANSLADVREAAAPFADLATSFLAKVQSGDVKLPFQAKGMENVVADITTRATAVADALSASVAASASASASNSASDSASDTDKDA